MKTLIALLCLCLSINHLQAKTLVDPNNTIELDGVTLYELAKLTLIHLDRTDFTADNEFINDNKKISFYVRDKSARQMKTLVLDTIKKNGYFIQGEGKLLFITKTEPEKSQEKPTPIVYTPKNKSAEYLINNLKTVFNDKSFSSNRSVDSVNFVNPISSNDKKPNDQKKDDGQSAFSLINKDTEKIVFNALKKDRDLFNQLVAELDTPDSQVEIKAYLYEIKNTESKQTGFSLAASLLGGIASASIGVAEAANSLFFTLPNLDIALKLFSSDSRFKLISSPYLLARNNQKAIFSVGADVPVLGQITQNQNGQTFQSIEYKQSGVILDVLPHIYDETIDLTIHHQISNFINTTTGVNNSPTLIKREMTTNVKTKHNDILLLGGLNEQTQNKSNSGFSLLPSFLRSNDRDKTDSEIMLLLSVKKI